VSGSKTGHGGGALLMARSGHSLDSTIRTGFLVDIRAAGGACAFAVGELVGASGRDVLTDRGGL